MRPPETYQLPPAPFTLPDERPILVDSPYRQMYDQVPWNQNMSFAPQSENRVSIKN